MKRIVMFIAIMCIAAAGIFVAYNPGYKGSTDPSVPTIITDTIIQADLPRTTVIAENLDTPWGIAFLPDGQMMVTERKGTVWLIDPQGKKAPELAGEIPEVTEQSEAGLLGIAIHPDFEENNWVYLYYTYRSEGNATLNRVVRMTFTEGVLQNQEISIDAIPGAPNHDGGRLAFGPDGYLNVTTGDAQNPSLAQDTAALAGKILRVNGEGDAAPGNPQGTRMYSYGHRNPQGIAWGSDGTLWATEHGRSGVQSGFDEINVIQPGQNYGWPDYQGDDRAEGIVSPAKHSGATTTWAPAGAAFVNESLYFAGLRGSTLYEAVIVNNEVREIRSHLAGEYGRLREVVRGPDGMLYVTTSNRDGRGSPAATDDRIIRVNPAKLTSS